MADTYVELFASGAEMHPDDLALIDRHLSFRSGTVLDVGCGPGHLAARLHALGVPVVGIDLVPEFIDHARGAHSECSFALGSMDRLPLLDGSVAGALAWYSLIHLPPDGLDAVLGELRRSMAPGAVLVAGFFEGNEVVAFDHQVLTAYYWPIDELSERLHRAGFTEVERNRRPGEHVAGHRPHAALVMVAS